MGGPGGHHPEWGNTFTKELTQYILTEKWILAQNLRYPRYNIQFAKHMKLKKNKVQSVDPFPFLELEQNTHGSSYRDKVCSWDNRMDHLETAISWDPSHNQPPNADTIAYTSKILLKGPRYSCLLWGYTGANTEVDAHSQLLNGLQGLEWRS